MANNLIDRVDTIDGTATIVAGSMIQGGAVEEVSVVKEIVTAYEARRRVNESAPRGHHSRIERFIMSAARDRIMWFGDGVVLLRTATQIVALNEEIVVLGNYAPDRLGRMICEQCSVIRRASIANPDFREHAVPMYEVEDVVGARVNEVDDKVVPGKLSLLGDDGTEWWPSDDFYVIS